MIDQAAMTGKAIVLTVPGLDGSGAGHWQTHWDAAGLSARVDLGDWSKPNRNMWVNRLNLAIHRAGRPVILVAHSLGCLAVAWWAHYENPGWCDPVVGALLVAPPEVDLAASDARLYGFAPTPLGPLPFPSVLVASRDDPYASAERLSRLAHFWGSDFVDAGELGHINAASGLGAWDDGKRLLAQLTRRAIRQRNAPPVPSLASELSIYS